MQNRLTCVVLCAGKGTRIYPFSRTVPKVMVPVGKKPVLWYVIQYWKRYADDFVFVVGYKKKQIIKYVKKLPIHAQFVEQKELQGIADAISRTRYLVSDQFLVILGDCICRGDFMFPSHAKQAIWVEHTKDKNCIKQNYSVIIHGDIVHHVKEKPKRVSTDLCGMGIYLFQKNVFEYIEKTPPSVLRNEVEITDVIDRMIRTGENFTPVFFEGTYMNVTYPEDAKQAESLFCAEKKKKPLFNILWGNIARVLLKNLLQKRAEIIGNELLIFVNDGDFLLDFGCGRMRVDSFLAQKKNISYTGVDVMRYDQRRKNLRIYDGRRLPFENNQFDVSVALFSLHHTDNPDFYLKELLRVTKRIVIFCEDTYTNRFEEVMTKMICLVSNVFFGNIDLRRRFKSQREWETVFARNKITVVSWKWFHPLPGVPARYALMAIRK